MKYLGEATLLEQLNIKSASSGMMWNLKRSRDCRAPSLGRESSSSSMGGLRGHVDKIFTINVTIEALAVEPLGAFDRFEIMAYIGCICPRTNLCEVNLSAIVAWIMKL
jgi:hypothetical protein